MPLFLGAKVRKAIPLSHHKRPARTPWSPRRSLIMRRPRLRTPNMRGGAVHIPSVSPRHSKTFRFVVRDAGSESRASMGSVFLRTPTFRRRASKSPSAPPRPSIYALSVLRRTGSESQATATYGTIRAALACIKYPP